MNAARAVLALGFGVAVAGAFACGACGGSSTYGPGGGASSGSSGSSGASSSGGLGASCPATQPALKTACSANGLQCEYGSDPDLLCDALVGCVNGQWGTSVAAPQPCPTPAAAPPCPASYSAAQTAGACTSVSTACRYPQGWCECVYPSNGPPIVGGPSDRWYCDAPASGCPTPRPRIGSPCNAPISETCDYGSCTLPGGVLLQCTGGLWQEAEAACAL